MAQYLEVSGSKSTVSYRCATAEPEGSYMAVSGQYLPITTNSTTSPLYLEIERNGKTYRPMEYKWDESSTTIESSSTFEETYTSQWFGTGMATTVSSVTTSSDYDAHAIPTIMIVSANHTTTDNYVYDTIPAYLKSVSNSKHSYMGPMIGDGITYFDSDSHYTVMSTKSNTNSESWNQRMQMAPIGGNYNLNVTETIRGSSWATVTSSTVSGTYDMSIFSLINPVTREINTTTTNSYWNLYMGIYPNIIVEGRNQSKITLYNSSDLCHSIEFNLTQNVSGSISEIHITGEPSKYTKYTMSMENPKLGENMEFRRSYTYLDEAGDERYIWTDDLISTTIPINKSFIDYFMGGVTGSNFVINNTNRTMTAEVVFRNSYSDNLVAYKVIDSKPYRINTDTWTSPAEGIASYSTVTSGYFTNYCGDMASMIISHMTWKATHYYDYKESWRFSNGKTYTFSSASVAAGYAFATTGVNTSMPADVTVSTLPEVIEIVPKWGAGHNRTSVAWVVDNNNPYRTQTLSYATSTETRFSSASVPGHFTQAQTSTQEAETMTSVSSTTSIESWF